MIEISHLNKKYKSQNILNNISFSLPKYGLIAITGPSGCGKTTLLKCICGLENYEGSISINGNQINNLSSADLDYFRLKNVGIIFQDFRLFEYETVFRNVILPLEVISNVKQEKKDRKCNDLLNIVGLEEKGNCVVNTLSGGEKQRVAIARSLANDPLVILADEPTGNLDEKNSKIIMSILRNISSKALVLLVSHDLNLCNEFADQIIYMRDGKIYSNEFKRKNIHADYLPLIANEFSNKKPALPINFLIKHTMNNFKEKKIRTGLSVIITSLGLVGVGLSVVLSSSISLNMKNAYSSFIDDDKVVVETQTKNEMYDKNSASYYEINSLQKKYPDLIDSIGVLYFSDFEDNFVELNQVMIASENCFMVLPDFEVRHFNEFIVLNNNMTIYPKNYLNIKNDELIIGLTMKNIEDICFNFRITRTINSLSEYLSKNDVTLRIALSNSNWQYSDEHLFSIKGFVVTNSPCIFHSNVRWNEYVFEDLMRFPTVDSLTLNLTHPWDLRKIFKVHSKNLDSLLLNSISNKDFSTFSFELIDEKYLIFNKAMPDYLLVFYKNMSDLYPHYVDYIREIAPELHSPIFGTDKGIGIYTSSLMSGFVNETYVSGDLDLVEKCVDANSKVNLEKGENLNIPNGVFSGHYSIPVNEGIRFHSDVDVYKYGVHPELLNEIAISDSLAKELFSSENVLFKTLYIANNNSTIVTSNNLYKKFKVVGFVIVGIFSSSKKEISHYSSWTVAGFQKNFDLSIFDLNVLQISFSTSEKENIGKTIDKLSIKFPNLNFINPLNDIESNIDILCKRFETITLIFALIASCIAILLLLTTTNLVINDNYKDFQLARNIGISEQESKKFLYFHSIILCIVSYFLSIGELLIISIFINKVLSKQLMIGFAYSFNPMALVFMLLLCFTIMGFSYFGMYLNMHSKH